MFTTNHLETKPLEFVPEKPTELLNTTRFVTCANKLTNGPQSCALCTLCCAEPSDRDAVRCSLPHTFCPSETEEGVQAVLDELATRVAKRRILVRLAPSLPSPSFLLHLRQTLTAFLSPAI